MNNENELIAALETIEKLREERERLAAENKRLTDVAQGGAFVMQKALMKYEFGVGMTMQSEDFIRDAREKHSATDRIFAETEARGVEKFAAKLRIPGDDQFFDALAKWVAIAADDFAQQLREGADK